MSDNLQPGEQPPVIVDKRGKGKAPEPSIEDSAVIAGAIGAPTEGLYTEPVEGETTDEVMARVDRIQELREKWQTTELGEDEKAELMRLQAEQEEADKSGADEGVEALTAFLVIISHDGSAVATHDVNQNLTIDREATTEDMFHGASVVVRDVTAAITSKHVVFGLQISAQAMQEKAAAIQQAQMLQGKVPNIGGRRPRR